MNHPGGIPATRTAAQRTLRIREISAQIIDIPTRRQHKLSNTSVGAQNVVIVALTLESGATGYGEAATLGGPRWAEESVESIKSAIDRYLAPALIGQDASRFEANHLRMTAAATRNFAAKAALETAALDAVGHTLDLPATALLGGEVRSSFAAIWALASGNAAQELEEARAHLDARRFNRFKIKLGFSAPRDDLARLRTLRDGLGPDTTLIVDVNQGWTQADALRWMPALQELDIALVEQPLAGHHMRGMADLARRFDLPIMLDEGVFTPEDVALAGALEAGHVLSLKLVKSGGAFALKRIAATASAHGMQLYGGCLLESSIGAAAHLATFATLPALDWGTEHFGPLILERDLAKSGLVYKDFHVHLPRGPGLGITPDPDALQAYARKTTP
ncbi:muconate/chloromuconate family cycloisomerase [Sulfitobacter sp. S190]|uniref:muconate/chloromuconate family cycloisomerase n=1 Tax=Sulfitobacter sp. S190 TaxID=2867022 RepID=UPI0021A835AE|nr:muconate/chloromuconate family cycloisomerase [Sulfitobacter sp. S190]UWR23170.1 muconate/chloromuconate family cycloisomerase [Sulfitobacter sp. S190]